MWYVFSTIIMQLSLTFQLFCHICAGSVELMVLSSIPTHVIHTCDNFDKFLPLLSYEELCGWGLTSQLIKRARFNTNEQIHSS